MSARQIHRAAAPKITRPRRAILSQCDPLHGTFFVCIGSSICSVFCHQASSVRPLSQPQNLEGENCLTRTTTSTNPVRTNLEVKCSRSDPGGSLPAPRTASRDCLQKATSLRDSLVHETGGIHPVGSFAASAAFASPASVPTTRHRPDTVAVDSTKTTHEVDAAEHPSANPRRRSLTRDSLEDNDRGKNATAETPRTCCFFPTD